MYVLLEFWQKIMAIPIMNPLSWFMTTIVVHDKSQHNIVHYYATHNFIVNLL